MAVGGDHGALDVYVPVGFARPDSAVFHPLIASAIVPSTDAATHHLRAFAGEEGV